MTSVSIEIAVAAIEGVATVLAAVIAAGGAWALLAHRRTVVELARPVEG